MGSATSSPIKTLSGVPQGLVLGPLLFLIYINDVAMVPISQDSKLNLFADDVLLYKTISTMEGYTATQGDINAIADWSDNNYLVLNPAKCKSTVISQNRKLSCAISEQLFIKYLGILLSCDISWSPHIAVVCLKACQMIGLLYRRFYLDPVADTHPYPPLYLVSSTTPGTWMSSMGTIYPQRY